MICLQLEINLSQEDKQKDKELHQRFATDPVAAMERYEEIYSDFEAADADGDGLLNLSEYTAFLQVQQQRAEQRGEFRARYDGYTEDSYQLFNSQDPTKEGFNKNEWLKYCLLWKRYERELAEADGNEF